MHRPAAKPAAPADHSRALVLGIETSCDETAAAVVEGGRIVRSNVIASQHELHAEYGGVVPEIASRAHAERLTRIVRAALVEAGIAAADVSAVAVGNRPGLIGSLLVGVAGAKALAWGLGVPLVGVDHVHAHLVGGLLAPSPEPPPPAPPLPALGLVVSGGHTTLFRLDSLAAPRRLGGTIDDAVGEAFDKVAAMLGLPMPGGPAVDRLAASGDPESHRFPVSRLGPDSLELSFSGLKTAVLYAVRGVPGSGEPPRFDGSPQARADLCAAFQHAAVAALILKLGRAVDASPGVRSLLCGGGVTANRALRAALASFAAARGLDLRLPPMAYCVDNAAMIAARGHDTLADNGWRGEPLSLGASPSSWGAAGAPPAA